MLNKLKCKICGYGVLWSKQDILDWIKSEFEIRHDY